MEHRTLGLVGLILTYSGSAIAQVSPHHPLFPPAGEAGSDPLVGCALLPEQLEADDAPESLWNANLWPGGVVPYEIDPGVSAINRDRLRLAMNELETYANLRFVPRNGEAAAVRVQNGTGNNSFVGRTGDLQIINLVSWSFRYIIIHELMHALGIWHEQQRSDRGNFVSIVSANIQSGFAGNFNIRTSAVPVGPFDFESVMLYDDCSFSVCCPAGSSCSCPVSCATILALPAYASQQNLMGNLAYLSDLDKAGLQNRYGVPVDDAFEQNDTPETARTPVGTPTLNLRLLDQDDYFRVLAGPGATVSARFRAGIWSPTNVQVTIQDEQGQTLASASPIDLDGDDVYDATASFVAPSPGGAYLVRIQRTQPFGGDYTLTLAPVCDAIDFNRDTLFPDSGDLDDFIAVLAGGPSACSTFPAPGCSDIDFNNDGLFPDSGDLDAFLWRLGGGACL
jgi:hypothetical protein